MQYGDCFVSAYTSCLPRVRGRIFLSSPLWMPMLMKETRLTRQKSIAEICTREREREKSIWCGKRGREFDIAHNESFQLGRTSSETHTHHSLSPLSLSFGSFYCVVYALCLSSRAHHIELLIVRPTKKNEKSTI